MVDPLAQACADLADLLPDGHDKCSCCGSVELVEALNDCSDLGAFVGLACADCEDELISAGHFETCLCASCERRRAKADRERRVAEAAIRVGGGAWLEDA